MIKTWSIAVVCGLAGLLGLGVVSLHAQQAEPKAEGEVSARKALRERLIALRTEVEILQIEHDADRVDLVETLSEHRTLLRKGPDEAKQTAVVQLMNFFDAREDQKKKDLLATLAKQIKESPEMLKELKDSGVTEFNEVTLAKLVSPEFLLKVEKYAGATTLRKSIDRKKTIFTRQSRDLNEKKLDLEDAEKRYSQIR